MLVALGCFVTGAGCGGSSGGDDGLTGFGPGGEGSTSEPPSDGSGSSTATTTGAGGHDGAATSGGDGSSGAEGGGASSSMDAGADSDGGDSGATTAGDDGSDDAPPDGAALGECLGIGAWETCAQWCGANDQSCVEAGCDGATVVYYDDVGACTSMRAAEGDAAACDAGFAMGGGVSFARCCCG